MDGNPTADCVFVVFKISFPSQVSRFVVPPGIANIFRGCSLFHFDIESDTGEQIFEGIRAVQPDGFDLGRTIDPGKRLLVQMEAESSNHRNEE
jgi:hypothetical protein